MNPDDAKAGETREWLHKASEDLASARVLAGSGYFANDRIQLEIEGRGLDCLLLVAGEPGEAVRKRVGDAKFH